VIQVLDTKNNVCPNENSFEQEGKVKRRKEMMMIAFIITLDEIM